MASDTGLYGTDLKWVDDDIFPSFELQSENLIVLEAISRRLQSKKGSLFYDRDYGFDIASLLNSPISGDISTSIENEVAKDERISFVNCYIAQDYRNDSITITLKIKLYTNKVFNLVFDLNQTNIDVAYERLSA